MARDRDESQDRKNTECGCSRRGLLCGAGALSLFTLSGAGQLVACSTPGSGGVLTGKTGDTGTAGGSGSEDTGPEDTGSAAETTTSTGGSTGSTTGGQTGSTGSSGGTTDPLAVCDDPSTICVDLSDPNNAAILGAVGSYGYLNITGDTLIIIHLETKVYDVLSAICTHQGCEVQYRQNQNDIYCGCHSSFFTLDGQVTGGPASRPLKSYAWDLVDNTLIIYT